MLYNILCVMQNDCNRHHRDKKYLIKYYIEKRLLESLSAYYSDIEKSVSYLENRKAENVVRKM